MRKRIIINSDAKNEADDQFAIVHALLSPSLDIVGIIPAHFGTARTNHSQTESRREVELLLELTRLTGRIRVEDGATTALADATTPIDSPGARLIVEAATRPGPLYVLFLGPLTDMASALLLEPTLADNPDLTIIWIGGTPYDGDHGGEDHGEFNLSNDIHAANVVLSSGATVWQIPWTVYAMVNTGHAELEERVQPHGELGNYLVEQLKQVNTLSDPEIEHRSLGDSPAVTAVLNPLSLSWRHHPVRVFEQPGRMTTTIVKGRTVQVADSADVRYLFEDFFAKLKRFAANR